MFHFEFRTLDRLSGGGLLILEIFLCMSAIVIARADERPVKPINGSVEKIARPHAAATSASSEKPLKEHVQQLIHDLGSPQYTARRAASTELRQIGSDAFDLLDTATGNADPEIASSATYLLRQIPIRWVQSDDIAFVRAQLRNYGQEPEVRRLQRVESLDRLSNGKGIPALCRIARYDRSLLVARTAAMAVIRPGEKASEQPHLDPEVVDRELGTSARAPALWLREYLAQIRDPAVAAPIWKTWIEAESNRLNKNLGDTSTDIVLGLTWNLADLYRQIGDQQGLNAALDRIIGLAADSSDETLISLMAWMTENKSWTVLDTFLSKHQARLEQSKRPLYYAALARDKQGKNDLAEELAAKAALITPQEGTLEGLSIAKDLEERLQFDWAVREYRRGIEKQPSESIDNILSRVWLANLLHDYEHEKEAAEAIEPLMKMVLKEGRMSQLYNQMRSAWHDKIDLPASEELAARYHFYKASQFKSEKNLKSAREEFESAVTFDPKDADVLIEMYRLPGADAQWREAALVRVRKLCAEFEKEITQRPDEAPAYNQWAWLVANTEGDFQQAIRYSHRSIELNKKGESGEASFLDTLGRCYYAAGDYENAVKYEREAVAKVDYLQVMQRQLKLFEKALADKKAGSAKESTKTN